MNILDKVDYESLNTTAQRAQWLLGKAREDGNIKVTIDIESSTLGLVQRVWVAGVMMPQKFFSETEGEAIQVVLKWLGEKTATE